MAIQKSYAKYDGQQNMNKWRRGQRIDKSTKCRNSWRKDETYLTETMYKIFLILFGKII